MADVGPVRIFGETDARKAWIAAEQQLLETFVDEYEMCCDDGYYTPTEQERELIRDALQGFLVEHDDLLAEHLAHAECLPMTSLTPDRIEEVIAKLRDWIDGELMDPSTSPPDRRMSWNTWVAGYEACLMQLQRKLAALTPVSKGDEM